MYGLFRGNTPVESTNGSVTKQGSPEVVVLTKCVLASMFPIC
jgi:hypothetical protein